MPCVVAFLATHAGLAKQNISLPPLTRYMLLTACVPVRNSRLPLDDDFEVCDEPPERAVYFTGHMDMGLLAYPPPVMVSEAMFFDWTRVQRPYPPRQARGSTRIERGNRSMSDHLGEFAFSVLNGAIGVASHHSPLPRCLVTSTAAMVAARPPLVTQASLALGKKVPQYQWPQ